MFQNSIGVQVPDILLPREGVSMEKMGGCCLRPVHLAT